MTLINNCTKRALLLMLPTLLVANAAQAQAPANDCKAQLKACEDAANNCKDNAQTCFEAELNCLGNIKQSCFEAEENEAELDREVSDEDFGTETEEDKAFDACASAYDACVTGDEEKRSCDSQFDACLAAALGSDKSDDKSELE